jgi:hypothetical protein
VTDAAYIKTASINKEYKNGRSSQETRSSKKAGPEAGCTETGFIKAFGPDGLRLLRSTGIQADESTGRSEIIPVT